MKDVGEITNQLRCIVSINRFLKGVNVSTSGEEFAFSSDHHAFDFRIVKPLVDGFGDDWQRFS